MVNKIDPAPDMGGDREQGSMTMCTPTCFSPPPQTPLLPPLPPIPPAPHHNPRNDQRLTLPCWKGGGEREEGGGGRDHLSSSS